MNLAVIIAAFLIILAAELPDKTIIASLVLGSRFRPRYVFAGAAAAFAVQTALAVMAGGLLSLLPHTPTQIVVAMLFIAGAILLLRQKSVDSDAYVEDRHARQTFLPVAATSFAVILAAEFGDLTQIMSANLAARYHDPLSVGAGAWRPCGWRRRWPSSAAAAC